MLWRSERFLCLGWCHWCWPQLRSYSILLGWSHWSRPLLRSGLVCGRRDQRWQLLMHTSWLGGWNYWWGRPIVGGRSPILYGSGWNKAIGRCTGCWWSLSCWRSLWSSSDRSGSWLVVEIIVDSSHMRRRSVDWSWGDGRGGGECRCRRRVVSIAQYILL